MGWRYIAVHLNGDGTETPVNWNVPIGGGRVIEDLSGPGSIEGTISPETERLQDQEGNLVLEPWRTAIFAESDRVIRGGAILTGYREDGPRLSLKTIGFAGYPAGQTYRGEMAEADGINRDPMDLARHIWDHLQSKPGGNLGLVLDQTTSKVRIGKPVSTTSFNTGSGEQVEFETGPYQLAEWKTPDLGKEFEDLAETAPFDYRVIHYWDGDIIRHRMQLGHPTIGRRLQLRFAVGENVLIPPALEYDGGEYADEVLVLGAGEGRKMVRSNVPAQRGNKLRRSVAVSRRDANTVAKANRIAAEELNFRLGTGEVTQVTVRNHPHTPIGSYAVGDEFELLLGKGWSNRARMWVRILSTDIDVTRDSVQLEISKVGD